MIKYGEYVRRYALMKFDFYKEGRIFEFDNTDLMVISEASKTFKKPYMEVQNAIKEYFDRLKFEDFQRQKEI